MRPALLEVVAQEPVAEAEHRYEGEPAEEELNLVADPALPGIYESDLRRIHVAPVQLVEVLVV